ncbi:MULTISPECIES: adenylyl-sulfate kinase [Cytobacillus]|uniref:Adenylyl-sulfate kinase n=3 Tax=Cytobacillus TaxID=2675230 RepID=A0A161IY16_9BACI|nr:MULTISPECIES: adenylyl-sulfate kinase [Cytobacillus]EFV75922.1 adenylyl-sulfate kinase [Bacillus sp. 2_A_57_CT2]AND39805.1 adenylyl-sulfate kinase [Cytobacillus oceanisediminis 2691]MBU8728926.1 adenylyl-sulfate kinase [Cytobacillus oceanisediminis]MCM3245998.1 adenylyl-sulfate kinase [Cytobacillus oceanisediminis]MCM3394423.1 adenylyl-sulfate kinase [Cytobacillus oceanisediminis]
MEKDKNLYSPIFKVTKEKRRALHGHNSKIIWFTGLSGSGKTTIANELEDILHSKGISTFILDGDNIRQGLNNDLGFSQEDRKENIRRIGEVAKLFVDSGIVVLVTFISPFASERKLVRDMVEKDEFIEVYVNCSLEECEKRDPKGLYQRAKNGEIKEFTGISSPYEVPENPEIILETSNYSIKECTEILYDYLKRLL